MAINLQQSTRQNLGACQQREAPEGINWVRPENFHFTLSFLGSASVDELPAIASSLSDIAAKRRPFTLEFEKIDFAPPARVKPSMIWAYFYEDDDYSQVSADINTRMLEVLSTLRPARRKMIPHITLARLTNTRAHEEIELKQPLRPIGTVLVERFDLMESELKKRGPDYYVLQSFVLGEG